VAAQRGAHPPATGTLPASADPALLDLLCDLVEHTETLFAAVLPGSGSATTEDAVARLGGSEDAVLAALARAVGASASLPPSDAEAAVADIWAELRHSDALLGAFCLRRRLRCDVVTVIAVDDAAAEGAATRPHSLLMGWDRATLGRVLLAACPGSHHTVVSDHAAVLAWHVHSAVLGGDAAWTTSGVGLWRLAKHGHGSAPGAASGVLEAAAAAAQKAAAAILRGGAESEAADSESDASRSRAASSAAFPMDAFPGPMAPLDAPSRGAAVLGRGPGRPRARTETTPLSGMVRPVRQTSPSPLLMPAASALGAGISPVPALGLGLGLGVAASGRGSAGRAAAARSAAASGAAAALAASVAVLGRSSNAARMRWSADGAPSGQP